MLAQEQNEYEWAMKKIDTRKGFLSNLKQGSDTAVQQTEEQERNYFRYLIQLKKAVCNLVGGNSST